jgi:hypothetical protein
MELTEALRLVCCAGVCGSLIIVLAVTRMSGLASQAEERNERIAERLSELDQF